MKYEEIALKYGEYAGTLYVYEQSDYKEMPVGSRPAMLVLPGGAYAMCSDRECEVVAMEFFNRGYNAYALKYPCAPARYPVQLVVAAMAMDTIRKRAKSAKTDPRRVFASGFSAGGHLCASLANCPPDLAEVKGYEFRPDGIVLGYPVISERLGEKQSFLNLFGGARTANCDWLELDRSVGAYNPPAFIWTTADDGIVPSVNSLAYAAAYADKGLKYELHVFRTGPHGMSVADSRVSQMSPECDDPCVARWTDYADAFLRSI